MFESWQQDARHAARALGRSPLFTLTAVLSLAIGIGATTAIFSLANTLLFRAPPGVGAPERLVDVGRSQDGRGFDNFSYPNFVDYRDRNTTLSGLAAVQLTPRSVSLAGGEGASEVLGAIVSGNFFDVLQVRPALGRFFLPEEDAVPGERPVVVLSHRFWRERFGGAADAVGRTLVLNGTPFTVVGVAPERFRGASILAPDLWAPMMSVPLLGGSRSLLEGRQNVWLMAVGRLKPGVERSAAQAELAGIARQLEQAYPEQNEGHGAVVLPASVLPGSTRDVARGFLALLLAVTALVLFIASTNVAGMLLARAAGRRREIAVRLALGASRRRLLRQLLTESVLLFLIAGAAGVMLAQWMAAGMLALLPPLPFPIAITPSLDARVLLFALGVSLAAGVLAGLAPALQSTRPALVPALKSDLAAGGGRLRLRSGLLVGQMALSMLLLVAAGLFLRALGEARAIDPGFDPQHVELASLDMRLANHDEERGQRFAATLAERAAAIPGVQAAALTAALPLDGGGLGFGPIEVPGRVPPDEERGWNADWNVITPGYFEVMRLPLLRGRNFTHADRAGTPDVAIINETLAGWLYPGEEAVGRTFRNDDRTLTIVGVARDAKYRTLGEDQRGYVYVPLAQRWFSRTSLIVRTAPGASAAAPVRRLVAELDATLPILDQQPLAEYTAITLFPQRIAAWVAGSLGAVALLLAVLGIYGVTAYMVTQRTREIGIRIALGAQRARVLRLVLRQSVVLAGGGVLLGVAAAAAATRLLRSLLYGVPPTDPATFAAAAALLVLAALTASWLPARRAARVDPMVALRQD